MRCCTRQALRYAGTAESSSAKAALSRSSSGVSWWPVCPPAMCALRRQRAFCGAIRYTFPQAASAEAICPCWSIKKGKSGQWSACCPTSARGRSAVHACTQKPGAVSLAAPARCSLFLWLLCGVASYAMPQILPMLFVPVVPALAGLLVSLEAFSVKACTKTPTARCPYVIPVFLPGMRFVCSRRIFPIRCWKTHFPSAGGRCDVRVHLPCGLQYRVRGVLQYLAREIPFTL